ncbi:hypothetical protein ACFQ21_20290 [Ohtaekwangia kribbensis]|jgi:hypothetical protein|uniref:Transposase n=1 Tax=Ohtaekwangia kribbensis TaxID=688913 RepID=A0ABW3K9H0_9BACT
MKSKKIKLEKKQSEMIRQSIDSFKNEAVKDLAKNYIGGLDLSAAYSQGYYQQFYSRV